MNIFFTLSLLSLLGKGHGHSFVKAWNPFFQRCFVPSLVEIGRVVLEKKKMRKVYDNDDGQLQIVIRTAHSSLRLRQIVKHIHILCKIKVKWTAAKYLEDNRVLQGYTDVPQWTRILFVMLKKYLHFTMFISKNTNVKTSRYMPGYVKVLICIGISVNLPCA